MLESNLLGTGGPQRRSPVPDWACWRHDSRCGYNENLEKLQLGAKAIDFLQVLCIGSRVGSICISARVTRRAATHKATTLAMM